MERQMSVVAVGAGPANLAFAAAVEEMAPDIADETLLVEQHGDIAWQRGMLLPWTQSQVGFLKDLVTLRNPRSRYSFVNFLHSTGRLDDFINLGSALPFRLEVSAYLQWVAKSLERVQVEYGRAATAITPVSSRADGVSDRWRVQFDTGEVVRCRNVVIGVGRSTRDSRCVPGVARRPADPQHRVHQSACAAGPGGGTPGRGRRWGAECRRDAVDDVPAVPSRRVPDADEVGWAALLREQCLHQ